MRMAMRMLQESRRCVMSRSSVEVLETRMLMAADVVLEWNTIAPESTKTLPGSQIAPTRQTRMLAMVHGAVFDAVNSVERDHEPYLLKVGAPRWASVVSPPAPGSTPVPDRRSP